ncbi:MAG: shikimate dehydrogenase [Deferrisomatales bacterium]|nr:shikimate dehydrogenase [Deferrisomatales bacterium]
MTRGSGNRAPTARTRLFGLVGHPVSHSLSPAMQNAAFRAGGLDAAYAAFDVAPEALGEALAGARALGFGGLNVTVPHKERALALAVEAAPAAARAGAANTLVSVPGGWRAHNTDGAGLVAALRSELRLDPTGRTCLILGAGGAARGAALGLLEAGAQEILLANRNEDRAAALARELNRRCRTRRFASVPLGEAPERLGPEGLLVSATPLGLGPGNRWPWEIERFARGTVAYDLAYRAEAETPLVTQARERGLRAASGLSMLLHQGALAFTLWTGGPAPLAAMGRALRRARAAQGERSGGAQAHRTDPR